MAWWARLRKGRGGASAPEPTGHEELTRRQELFGVTQLENHARFLASQHTCESVRGERLLRQLAKGEASIRRCHQAVAESLRLGHRISPAAEWLLDNFHLIQEQIELAEAHLSPGYSRELPRLKAGPGRGLPRIYAIAMELVGHTDGQVDHENLSRFVRAYQETHALTLGELWAVPIALRLSLIENLRLVAQQIEWRRSQRDTALRWAQRFLTVVETNPRMVVATLGDFVRTDPLLTAPFISELVGSIEGVNPALGLVLNWLEQDSPSADRPSSASSRVRTRRKPRSWPPPATASPACERWPPSTGQSSSNRPAPSRPSCGAIRLGSMLRWTSAPATATGPASRASRGALASPSPAWPRRW